MKTNQFGVLSLLALILLNTDLSAAVCDRNSDITQENAKENEIVNCYKCGNNCSARIDSSGKMTVSGTGEMYNYGRIWSNGTFTTSAPWWSRRTEINNLEIEYGITSVGTNAFEQIRATDLKIADSVTAIKYQAFDTIPTLTSIVIPASVTTIEQCAFCSNKNLETIVISNPKTSLNGDAFTYDSKIKMIYCPSDLTSCKNLADGNSKKVIYYDKIGDYYQKNGKTYRNLENMIKGIEMKRIYTVEEATNAVGKNNKNTFSIRYR